MMTFHAELRMEEKEEFGSFKFDNLTDADVLALYEIAAKGGKKVSVRFWAENRSEPAHLEREVMTVDNTTIYEGDLE